ncbi:AMIN domain-containing protein [Aliikangiella coralliicola]|uniref:N-acetylmuramoyl-L-alanine amidase n=1 Tax=Aliikangiella coralliicola TaxID=2592383 RepID=A0A545UCP1_9GAMM|nr:AMIN domain-containing protein [Aliikangiella coralliicola]
MLLLFTIHKAFAGDVSGIRFWQDPEKTRLVFDVDEEVDYKLFTLDDPYRLVVDIQKAKLKTDLSRIEIPKQLVSKIRSSQKADKLRIVIDLKNGVTTKHFALKPFQSYGHRLVVDLRDKNGKKQVVKTASSVLKNKNRDIVIAIDAGHGGDDPGALGPKGTLEKNITLAVAKKLASRINKEKGFKAFLTRSSDYYVGLETRTKLARKNKADLFISLHADGFRDPRVRGASVWVLSPKGANSEMGKWLEQREKSSDLLGGVESLQNKDPLVAQVLIDLSMHYSVGESIKAAEKVRKQLSRKMSKMHGKGLRKAAFMVLRMPDIPAMLVEMAFISNPGEEKLLKTTAQQNKIAQAVFAGVKQYFKTNPPDGSYYATLSKSRSYKVKSGDTLSQIAQNFGVTTSSIKSRNKLKSNNLKIGQTLMIPGV